MIYTVTYRDASGVTTKLELDVANRNAVWPELEKRGIKAISVVEGATKSSGWNRPKSATSQAGGSRPSSLRGILAGVLVVALASVALWFLMGRENKTVVNDPVSTKSKIKDATPSKPKATKPEAPAPTKVEKTKAVEEVKPEEPKVNPRLAPSTAKKYPRRVIPRKPEPPQKFKYDSDDLIGAFLEIAPGDQVEAGLRFDKIGRDFEKSLLEDVALAEGQDNEYNKQLREMVRETKKEIQKVMKEEGKTFGQVMQEQFDQLIELGQYRRALEQELREIRKSGEYTPEEYEKFIEASNAMLRGKGCSELKVPKATFYQVELYRQRRAAKEAMGLEKETKESKEAAKEAMNNLNGGNEE